MKTILEINYKSYKAKIYENISQYIVIATINNGETMSNHFSGKTYKTLNGTKNSIKKGLNVNTLIKEKYGN